MEAVNGSSWHPYDENPTVARGYECQYPPVGVEEWGLVMLKRTIILPS